MRPTRATALSCPAMQQAFDTLGARIQELFKSAYEARHGVKWIQKHQSHCLLIATQGPWNKAGDRNSHKNHIANVGLKRAAYSSP